MRKMDSMNKYADSPPGMGPMCVPACFRIPVLILLVFLALPGGVRAENSDVVVSESRMDTNGVRNFSITSPFQSQQTELRILAPPGAASVDAKRFLYVLPVEPGGQTRYGDGLAELHRLGVHTNYGIIVVAPRFADLPWYADHPTNLKRQDETYLLQVVLPLVDRLHPAPRPRRFLLGFSKSGWGALSLLLRHPGQFEAAAAWDAPLMKTKPDQFGMADAFATQENFERYQISRLLREQAGLFCRSRRLGLFGYDGFRSHMREAHELMESLSIPHEFSDGPHRPHRWDGGWLAEAVAALDKLGPR